MHSTYGIIGASLGHSLSPSIFEYLFRKFNIESDYISIEAGKNALPDIIRTIRRNNIKGVNVTFPHKQAALLLLDELDITSKQIGAVNTILNDNGILRGFNTDQIGLSATLRTFLKLKLAGEYAIILGAGGAARACLQAIIEHQPQEILIINRTLNNAEKIIPLARRRKKNTHFRFCSIDDINNISAPQAPRLIINATSADNGAIEHVLQSISNHAVLNNCTLLDLNYGERAVCSRVQHLFLNCYDGAYMLAAQAAESFCIWTGHRVDAGEIYDYLVNRAVRS